MKIHIPEITFSMAHYIPGHERGCGAIHGHTYYVRDLTIWPVCRSGPPTTWLDHMGILVDFGVIKQYFKDEWDHKFAVPTMYEDYWGNALNSMSVECRLDNIKGVVWTTAEGMAYDIKEELAMRIHEIWRDQVDLLDHVEVKFGLYEGPGQGILV